jgi:hypothetical protein
MKYILYFNTILFVSNTSYIPFGKLFSFQVRQVNPITELIYFNVLFTFSNAKWGYKGYSTALGTLV